MAASGKRRRSEVCGVVAEDPRSESARARAPSDEGEGDVQDTLRPVVVDLSPKVPAPLSAEEVVYSVLRDEGYTDIKFHIDLTRTRKDRMRWTGTAWAANRGRLDVWGVGATLQETLGAILANVPGLETDEPREA